MVSEIDNKLTKAAQRLAGALAEKNLRIVFAESCTAGLVSATLAQVAGISQWHCGSAVTYRETTKTAWLAIPPAMIDKHGVVSSEIAQLMAAGVLQFTPEADIAAAITGHLGPDAPPELDGIAYIAVALRTPTDVEFPIVERIELESTGRTERQKEAALSVLERVAEHISP